MTAMIEEYKKEHSGIIKVLKEVEKLGIFTKEGHDNLMILSLGLLKHLWHEDEWLYPVVHFLSLVNKMSIID